MPRLRRYAPIMLAVSTLFPLGIVEHPLCHGEDLKPLPPVLDCAPGSNQREQAPAFPALAHGGGGPSRPVAAKVAQASYRAGSDQEVGSPAGTGVQPAAAQFRLPGGAVFSGLLGANPAWMSSLRLANDFNSHPSFDQGVMIRGQKISMKIGGYVKADLIKDFDPIDSTDTFDTTTIPTDAADRQNARFHARQTRMSADTRWQQDGYQVRTFIEADFFGKTAGGSDAVRLRHAYGTIGRVTAGQTWTTFTDPAAVPQTLDFEGGKSSVNRRQGLVRWTQPVLVDGLSLAIALENPRVIVDTPAGLDGQGRTETPDFIVRSRFENEWGQFQAAGLVRRLGFQPLGEPVVSKTAWGLNFTGSMLLTEEDIFYYQITFGDGIGSYRGSPDIVATGPTTAVIQSSFGWMIGSKHEWTDRLTSNFTFSDLSLDNLPGQADDNLRRTQYIAANLILNPFERVFVGLEYLYGFRQDVNGAHGDAHRLQSSFGFYLP